jgi:hypothetical protein
LKPVENVPVMVTLAFVPVVPANVERFRKNDQGAADIAVILDSSFQGFDGLRVPRNESEETYLWEPAVSTVLLLHPYKTILASPKSPGPTKR